MTAFVSRGVDVTDLTRWKRFQQPFDRCQVSVGAGDEVKVALKTFWT